MTENDTVILQSSTPSLLEEADNEEAERLLRYNRYFTAVFISIILVMGIPGNILTIIVLRRRRLKDNFMSLLLTWLAVSNLSVMLVNAPSRFIKGVFNIDIWSLSATSCNVQRALAVVCIIMSNWMLILVTACRGLYLINVQRTLAVCKPRTIHVIVLAMYGLAILFHVLTRAPIRYAPNSTTIERCDLTDSVKFKMFHVILLCYLPGTILVALNALMLYTVRKQVGQSVVSRTKFKPGQHLFILVILANVLFIICTIPFAVYYPLKGTVFGRTAAGKARDMMVLNIAISVLYLSPAMNFLIYCFFGSRFRRELLYILEPCLLESCNAKVRSLQYSSALTCTGETLKAASTVPAKHLPQNEDKLDLDRAVPSAQRMAREAEQEDSPILKLRSDQRIPDNSHSTLSEPPESVTETEAEDATNSSTHV